MKKSLALMLAVLLCILCLAGCKEKIVEPPAFTFLKAAEAKAVKQLVITDGEGKLEDVGHVLAERGQFCLTGEYMNGTPSRDGELYYYVAPDAYVTLRKRENVVGVLLVDGVPYGAFVTDDGGEMICTLDETFETQTWTAFYNEALKAQK